ncbi:sulfatase-like hydrolase/transferase [Halegenticoccus tardaugens]|uniref:sulfatase-like hydrolase/transferase n=1 Tax=Halegenticoccus tardaugens TaxID=2071624 RepID=UPI00100A6F01|nr:sulfatase-like hydrolase/transferase [Halegenticoccus tardaugens]
MTNIALVVLDTLRKDTFDKHFDWLPGRRFEWAYSTANWTVPAHASLFTGLYPSEVGIHAKHIYCDCDEPTLAEQLQKAGYTTRAFSANTNITSHFNFDRGFNDFNTPDEFEKFKDDGIFDFPKFSRETNTYGIKKYLAAAYECVRSDASIIPSLILGGKYALGDNEITEYGGAVEALDAISEMEFSDHEFLFMNLMEAHEPYRAPEEYMTVEEPGLTESIGDLSFGGGDKQQIQLAYDDCARYLSDIYKTVFNELRTDFDYIITLSDHGEMLGEHNAWGHEHGVYPELTHIPLCISGSGLSGSCHKTVNLLDVHSTILDIAEIEGDGRGQPILSEVGDHDRLTEYMGLTSWSERKLTKNGHEEQLEKYNNPLRGIVSNEKYYGFESNSGFIETRENYIVNGEKRLKSLVKNLNLREVDQQNEVPDEVKNRLEDLGYA